MTVGLRAAFYRYVNDRRLAVNERQILREGDIVSFGGGTQVKVSPGLPNEANPFLFRVKHLDRVIESNAARSRARQSLQETQLPASNLQSDCIDLTVSKVLP